jgi:hypothetical protein
MFSIAHNGHEQGAELAIGEVLRLSRGSKEQEPIPLREHCPSLKPAHQYHQPDYDGGSAGALEDSQISISPMFITTFYDCASCSGCY